MRNEIIEISMIVAVKLVSLSVVSPYAVNFVKNDGSSSEGCGVMVSSSSARS